MLTLINRNCTLIQRGPSDDTDRFGNQEHTEVAVETVCELQQKRRDEADQEGELSDTLWDVFFLPPLDVKSGDGLVVDGEEYEFVGDPWEARNPRTQEVEHIEATVRRTSGPSDEGES